MPKQPTDRLKFFRENLARELDGLDSKRGASQQAELGETFVRDVIERGRDPRLSNIAQLAKAHGLSLDRLLGLPGAPPHIAQSPIKVVGEVAAGKWQEVDSDFDIEDSPFPPDPRYPVAAQFDLIVRGNSINNFARDGERLRCLDIMKAGIEVFDDDLVIFRRTKDEGQLIETTAKRFRRRGPVIELWPDSDDKRWQEPLRLDPRKAGAHDEGQVIALVLYSYNPARLRSR